MKILFISLGCDKNLVDTEMMLGMLTGKGYFITNDENEADVVVINTCCFINDAKEESIQTILEMAELKKSGNIKALIVAGCLAQRYKEEIQQEIPEVDAIVGTTAIDSIVEALEEAKANGFPISIEGSAQYDVKYVPQYSIGSEKLKDVRARHTTKSSWIMRTSLDVFKDDVVEPFNKSKKGLAGVKEANGGGTPALHVLSSGLDGSPVNSNEFAVAIYCINSKAQLDQLNQILKECATRQAGDNPDNLIASWCLRSGRPDLLRHLGQYDPYFQDLYNKTKKQNTAK